MMKKAAIVGAFAAMVALAAQSAAFGQTVTPTSTTNTTVTASPTPTTSSSSNQGTSTNSTTNTTVPNGAPSTGHGE